MQDNNLIDVNLTSEMKTESFIGHAMRIYRVVLFQMFVTVLKPVQRRILYGMNSPGVTPDKRIKSARITGDVMGEISPTRGFIYLVNHGPYGTMVELPLHVG